MRDVGEDLGNDGRIYLPAELLSRFGCSEEDLKARRHSPAFVDLMDFLHLRASSFYDSAAEHVRPSFRRRLVASEMMATTYREILEKMRRDRYRVFEHRYGLSKFRKATIFASYWIQAKALTPFPADEQPQ